ncbi:MAG: hypothetical protein QM820_56410 [Minicystis sp.]
MKLVRWSALAGAVALALAGGASLTGCPPGLDDPERFQTGCPAGYSVESMMRDRCSGSTCHGGGNGDLGGGLDLVSTGAFERMFGKTSTTCMEMLISPLGPDQSLLVHKIEGTPTCGARMPLGATPLAASDIACVREWITAGIDGGTLPTTDAGEGDAGDAGPADAGESDAGDAGEPDAGDAGDMMDSGSSDAGAGGAGGGG